MPDIIENTDIENEVPNPRDEMMQRIVEDNRESRDESIAEDVENHGVAEELVESAVPPPPPDESSEVVESPVEVATSQVDNSSDMDNTPVIERNGEQFLRIKVNGELQEVPISTAVTNLQKSGNADLQTKLAVESKQRYDTALQNLSTAPQKKSTQSDDMSEVDASKIQSGLESALDGLYNKGDIEGSAKTISDLIVTANKHAAPVQTGVSVAEVTAIVGKVADHENAKNALNKFKADERFSNIAADPVTLDWIDKETDLLQSDLNFMSTNPSYDDIFEAAGTNVLEKLRTLSPSTDKVDVDTAIEQRLEKKRKQPAPVTSRSGKRAKPPEAPPPKTNSDIIADLKLSRGQTY